MTMLITNTLGMAGERHGTVGTQPACTNHKRWSATHSLDRASRQQQLIAQLDLLETSLQVTHVMSLRAGSAGGER